MEHARHPQSNDASTLERNLALLRTRLRSWDDEHRDIVNDLRRLRYLDPLAEETIRHFAEKYFPGADDIRRKAKAVRMLTAAFLVLSDTKQSLDGANPVTPQADLHADENENVG